MHNQKEFIIRRHFYINFSTGLVYRKLPSPLYWNVIRKFKSSFVHASIQNTYKQETQDGTQ
jgi:hypothetical protein